MTKTFDRKGYQFDLYLNERTHTAELTAKRAGRPALATRTFTYTEKFGSREMLDAADSMLEDLTN